MKAILTQTPPQPATARKAATPARDRAAALQITMELHSSGFADSISLAIVDLENQMRGRHSIVGVPCFEINGNNWTYAWPLHRVAIRILEKDADFTHIMRMADADAQILGWAVFTFRQDEIMAGIASEMLAECIEHSRHRLVRRLQRQAETAIEELKSMNRYGNALKLREAIEAVR